jgi:hypothetical protein
MISANELERMRKAAVLVVVPLGIYVPGGPEECHGNHKPEESVCLPCMDGVSEGEWVCKGSSMGG